MKLDTSLMCETCGLRDVLRLHERPTPLGVNEYVRKEGENHPLWMRCERCDHNIKKLVREDAQPRR